VSTSKNYIFKDFNKANYDLICAALNLIDWDNVFSHKDIDTAVNTFYVIINLIIDEHVPKEYRGKPRYPKWFSAELRKLIQAKITAHKTFKKTGYASDYNTFPNLRAQCKIKTRFCYRDHLQCTNPKLFTT